MFLTAAFLIAAPIPLRPVSPEPEHWGWSLRVERECPKGYLIPGEDLGVVKLTLTNRAEQKRTFMSLMDAFDRGRLEVNAKQNGKHVPHWYVSPAAGHPAADPINLQPGKTATCSYPLWKSAYHRITRATDVEVTVTLRTDQGLVKSAPLTIEVVNLEPRAVKLSKSVPLAEREQQTDGTASVVVVQIVEIENDRWLLYRRFLGPTYGGGIEFTHRLAEAKGVTDFVVSGQYGDDKPLTVKYKHSPTGTTTITFNAIDGTIEKKVVMEK